MFRIGLMGCGMVADFGHAPAIAAEPNLELVACFDRDPLRATAFVQKYGGTGTSVESEFFSHQLDAVVVASSLGAHHSNVLACARHRVHVLCEKPIAESSELALDMHRAMKQADRELFIGMTYRFSPVVHQLRAWLDNNEIGELRHVRMVYLWNLHGQFEKNSIGEWGPSQLWAGRMDEGGPLIDCGVHQLDLIQCITGRKIVAHEGFGAWISDYEAPDHLTAHLQLQGGLTASVEVSFSYTHNSRDPRSVFTYELIGTGGVARFDREGYVLEARSGKHTLATPGTGEKNFEGMYSALERFLSIGDRGQLATPEEAMDVSDIASQCTAQAIARRIVDLA